MLNSCAVRRLRTQLFHELSAFVHTIPRLRLVRFDGEKSWIHLIPQFRHGRCQGMVPDQLSVGRSHLYGLEESGESHKRALPSR